jgi:MFS family permease
MNMAIAGFCVIGIAFGTQPLLHAVTSEVLPRRWRAYGQAADMVSNGVGSIIGLVVGGALNRTGNPASDGFRYYFYMTMAWFAISAVITALVYNPPETEKMRSFTTSEKLAKLDWIGYFLLSVGLVLFCVGLSYSQNPYPWSDPHVSATFAVGMAGAIALVVYETYFKKDGMFHHGLFSRDRNFAISVVCIFAEGVAFFAANTYFAFQVSVLYEHDALIVGTRYSIMLISLMIASVLTGWYCAATRQVRWITVVAFVLFIVFFACMATTNRDTDLPVWGYPVILGFALGMTLTTLITAGQLSTPPELIAVASGLIISMRSLGGTVGIAIYNALFTSAMSHLGENIAHAVIPAGLAPENLGPFIGALAGHNETALMAVPGVNPAIIGAGAAALLDTFVLAFRHVWIAGGCFVAVAAIGTFHIPSPQPPPRFSFSRIIANRNPQWLCSSSILRRT